MRRHFIMKIVTLVFLKQLRRVSTTITLKVESVFERKY